jgi:hypothetical protein
MTRRTLSIALAAGLVCVVAGRARAQMPDPRMMSGQIIPSPDLPAGTVTVRVIRQTIMNVVGGVDVELHGAGDVRHATTGPEGRAQFSGLPVGARVHAVAVVDGERLESIEFEVPGSGGVRTLLAAGVGVGTRVGGQSGQPAQPGRLVLAGDTRFAVEFQDDTMAVFYLLDIVNRAAAPVTPERPFEIRLPAGASAAAILDGGSPLASIKGDHVMVTGPLPPGTTSVPVGFRLESWGDTWRLEQTFPLPIEDIALAVQKFGDLRMQSPSAPTVRETTLQGTRFIVATGASLPAGTPLSLTLSGLPHKSRLPIYLALALSVGLVLWGFWMTSLAPAPQAMHAAGRRQELDTRRARGLEALAALERASRAMDRAAYTSRRHALVEELERIYSELDEAGGLPGGGQGLPA